MLDVCLISNGMDYSNVGYNYAKALQESGINAVSYATQSHIANYPQQSAVCESIDTLSQLARQFKIVQFMQSRYLNLNTDMSKLGVVVYHGADEYRRKSRKLNRIFNPIVDTSIIQTLDLWGLGAKNEVWILPTLKIDEYRPDFTCHCPLKIAHFPSCASTKGTLGIVQAVQRMQNIYKVDFDYSDQGLISWKENMQRIAKCDIYIEACQPIFRGKRYGEWGVAALEACALGKVVITHSRSAQRYKEEYGIEWPLQIANSPEEIVDVLRRLLSLNSREIMDLQQKSREWVERYHGYLLTAHRLIEKVYNPIIHNKNLL